MKPAAPFFTAIAFAAALFAGSVFAADPAPAKQLTPQQQKMSDCSKQGHEKGLTGADYKAHMSTCLKGGTAAATPAVPAPAPAKPMTQQEKMKVCNADATSKKLAGDDRKTYMSTCLKSDGSAAAAAH